MSAAAASTRRGRASSRACVAVLGLLAACAACGEQGGDRHVGSASCPSVLEFQGHEYRGGPAARPPRSAGPAGPATVPPCNDVGPDRPRHKEATVGVEAIVGVPISEAVMIKRSVYLAEGLLSTKEPFHSWFAVTCQRPGTTSIQGTWTSIIGTDADDGTPPPPYTVQVQVDDLPEYGDLARASVIVQVLTPAAATLTHEDAVDVLQKGGRISVQLHCQAGSFIADALLAERS